MTTDTDPRTCRRCDGQRPLHEFPRHGRGGRLRICRTCKGRSAAEAHARRRAAKQTETAADDADEGQSPPRAPVARRPDAAPESWTAPPDPGTAGLLAAIATARADVEALRRAVAGGREGHSALGAAEWRLHLALRALDRAVPLRVPDAPTYMPPPLGSGPLDAA